LSEFSAPQEIAAGDMNSLNPANQSSCLFDMSAAAMTADYQKVQTGFWGISVPITDF
jgi:Na+-transporting NADH:ubiquinone oxidoreductase subunit NqrB